MLRKNIIWLIMLTALSLGCSLNDQSDEANKLVDEANVIIEKYNTGTEKLDALFNELFGDNLTQVEDFKAYKEKNKSKFDEVISLSEQIEKMGIEIINKFEQASELKLSEKYKEYLKLRIREIKKRTDAYKLHAPFVEKILQTNDVDKINRQIEDYNNQIAEITKEIDALAEKARQIAKDNPDEIKN